MFNIEMLGEENKEPLVHMLFNIRGEMISFIDQYYNVNRKLLKIMGLWPYQKWRCRIFQITLFPSVLISFLIAQLATFLTSKFNVNLMLTVLSQAFPCLIYFLTYISFLLNNKQIKMFFERLRYEWMTLKATDEIDILKKYADFSRLFTVTMAVLMLLVLNSFGLFQFLPNLLDVIIPLNESRERHFSFLAEYFVDQEQYFYFILTHNLVAVYIGGISIISTGTMLVGFIMHICAMLKIASYRLEHINDNLPSVSKYEKDCIICKRIINAVDIHRRALEFGEYILSSFSKLYFILIGVGIASLTINMFQLLQLMMFTNDTNGMLACGLLVIVHFCYMFIGNLVGQVVTDHNTDILTTTYAVQWYTISLQAQKLLLFIMQRNTKNYYFTIGSVFVASLEGFASMTSMTVSYFTMIYSTR